MFVDLICTCFLKGLGSALLKRNPGLSILILFSLLTGCVSLRPTPAPLNLAPQQLTTLIGQMAVEQQKVNSFFVQGNLDIKNWYGDAEVNILAIGTQNPFRLKVEVSHSWGNPLLYLLIDQSRMEILSFTEQTYYFGEFRPQWMTRFLGVELSADIIWATLRGYPLILIRDPIRLQGSNPVVLLDEEAKPIEQITIQPETFLPEEVLFSQSKLLFRFSDFQQSNQILFAKKIQINHVGQKQALSLRYVDAVFNEEVPSQIFSISKPLHFKTVELSEQLLNSPMEKR